MRKFSDEDRRRRLVARHRLGGDLRGDDVLDVLDSLLAVSATAKNAAVERRKLLAMVAASPDLAAGNLTGGSVRSAAASILPSWLEGFGPATETDIRWWTGWTVAQMKPLWTTSRRRALRSKIERPLRSTASFSLSERRWFEFAFQPPTRRSCWSAGIDQRLKNSTSASAEVNSGVSSKR